MGGEGGGGGEEDECSGYQGIGPTGNCGYHQILGWPFRALNVCVLSLRLWAALQTIPTLITRAP